MHSGVQRVNAWALPVLILGYSRARADERHLIDLFGQPYRDCMHRVKRWVPGIY